jgi:hypothetical protein
MKQPQRLSVVPVIAVIAVVPIIIVTDAVVFVVTGVVAVNVDLELEAAAFLLEFKLEGAPVPHVIGLDLIVFDFDIRLPPALRAQLAVKKS